MVILTSNLHLSNNFVTEKLLKKVFEGFFLTDLPLYREKKTFPRHTI